MTRIECQSCGSEADSAFDYWCAACGEPVRSDAPHSTTIFDPDAALDRERRRVKSGAPTAFDQALGVSDPAPPRWSEPAAPTGTPIDWSVAADTRAHDIPATGTSWTDLGGHAKGVDETDGRPRTGDLEPDHLRASTTSLDDDTGSGTQTHPEPASTPEIDDDLSNPQLSDEQASDPILFTESGSEGSGSTTRDAEDRTATTASPDGPVSVSPKATAEDPVSDGLFDQRTAGHATRTSAPTRVDYVGPPRDLQNQILMAAAALTTVALVGLAGWALLRGGETREEAEPSRTVVADEDPQAAVDDVPEIDVVDSPSDEPDPVSSAPTSVPTPSTSSVGPGTETPARVAVSLEVGTCFSPAVPGEATAPVLVIPCESSHGNEVFARLEVPTGADEAAAQRLAQDACVAAFADAFGRPYAESGWGAGSYYSSDDGSGTRVVVCHAFDPNGPIIGPISSLPDPSDGG